MRSRFRDDRGSVTAELAIALPAVVLMLALCVGSIGVAAQQVHLQHAAAQAAREAGRQQLDEIVCVTLTEQAAPPLSALTLSAHSCAPGGGR